MYWLIAFVFIGLPFGMAVFLCWRAYQLAIKGRVELAHQWLPAKAPGIERFAKLLAVRDLVLAFGCLLYLVLLFSMPKYFTAWTGVMTTFGLIHQAISYFAIRKAKKAGPAQPNAT